MEKLSRYIKVGVAFCVLFQTTALWGANCPTPHPKYTELLKKLDGIKNHIKDNQECKTIAKDFDELHKKYAASNRSLIDPARSLAEKPIKENKNYKKEKKELTIKQINALTEYAEDITGLMGSIVEKLNQQPVCLEREDTPTLLTIAQITQEVSGISAQYSGPYGVPISVAGAAVSGILKGIYAFQARRGGYDFSKRENRSLFVSSLCSYHDTRLEVESLINPERRSKLLELLKDAMKDKTLLLTDPSTDLDHNGTPDGIDCEECRKYHQYFDASKKIVAYFKSDEHELEKIKQLIDEPNKEFDTCILLSRIRESMNDGIKELDSILSFSPQDVQEMRDWMSTLNYIPDYKSCMKHVNAKTLKDVNFKSLAVFEYLASDSERALDEKMDELYKIGETKKIYVSEQFPSVNPVDYLAHALLKIDWSAKEVALMTEMANGGSAQIQREINESNLFLRERFFDVLSPDFLNWHMDDALNSIKNFERQYKQIGFELEQNVLKKEPSWLNSWGWYSSELIKDIEALKSDVIQEHSYVFSRLNQLILILNTSVKSKEAVDVYCDYFKLSLTLSGVLHETCQSSKKSQLEKSLETELKIAQAMQGYLDWAIDQKKVEIEPVTELLKRVRAFNETLMERSQGNVIP